MLLLRRSPGQWVELTHAATGDRLRIGVDLDRDRGHVRVTVDDALRRFEVVKDVRGNSGIATGVMPRVERGENSHA